jgi:hypothetical protein
MTYTKAYRHRIYKKALKAFDKNPDGLCIVGLCTVIRNVNPDRNHIFGFQTTRLFSELAAQMPKGADPGDFWWSKSTRGHNARRRALVRCIELTAPTPRKKP